ncbi:MAG: hypothetical protein ABS58_09270 [Mesorhizobium sp. SCN 65-20]|nr:MAG: hypothetical protein ABS58_09270 [Mesorhizobium sp. SCN 65-20]
MKKIFLAAASLVLMSGAALATEANGVVTKFNPQTRVITLNGGKSFTIPRDVALPAVHVGGHVSIVLNDEGDRIQAVLTSRSMM